MLLAISFLETPLKFRAPGVTVPIGLGIGRLVFRALNIVETIFAVTMLVAICLDVPTIPICITVSIALLALALQLVVIRPRLTARSNAILNGLDAPRSRAHYAYIGLEALKVVALTLAGVLLLAAATGGQLSLMSPIINAREQLSALSGEAINFLAAIAAAQTNCHRLSVLGHNPPCSAFVFPTLYPQHSLVAHIRVIGHLSCFHRCQRSSPMPMSQPIDSCHGLLIEHPRSYGRGADAQTDQRRTNRVKGSGG